MSFLRGSMNYVWSTTSVLGKGATGAVYQGVNKTNGEPVAVKTFNQESHRRPQSVQMREFDVLKRVKHENIVKLLAIEEEQEGRGNVIVMELCTGGSLFSILDDPENTYGLCEEEFLLVLEHLTAGMKHLRDNNLVHRDLKPGNIMKFISDDGTTVYKLTDFGAARELQEGQQFVSLYGTEEYLHPDMYARAVLHRTEGKMFGATVDLWSIGVTLYHVATGNLPFRPFGGRRNRETMLQITTKKASGCISGVQTKENGPIKWGFELPGNCQLSDGLKKFATPLLAGLLEADPKKIWSFDRFFRDVKELLSRKVVNVFHANRASLLRLYVHPDEKYDQLQGYVTEQTKISAANHILLMNDKLFLDLIREESRAGGYPDTTTEEPLILFSKDNNNVEVETKSDLPKFTEFQNLVHVENDATQAKAACSLGYECKRRIEKASLSCRLICKSVECLAAYLTRELDNLYRDAHHFLDLTESYGETSRAIALGRKSLTTCAAGDSPKASAGTLATDLADVSDAFLKETKPKVEQLRQQNVTENKLRLEWDCASKGLSCPSKTRAPAKAATEVERLRDSWQHLVRDRATRNLNYNDEQFHNLERIKITETIRRLRDLLEADVRRLFVKFAENLSDWYKIAQTVYLKTMILKHDLDSYQKELDKFHERLALQWMQYEDEMNAVVEQNKEGLHPVHYQNSKRRNRQLNGAIKKFDKNKREIMEAIVENSLLIEQISSISEKLRVTDENEVVYSN